VTLSEKAYHAIRNAIIFNEMSPGDILTEEHLSDELSISRTPVRTALHRLVNEGLAEVRGKSITVSSITSDDISSINTVRLPLELLVIDQLKGKVTTHLIRQLRGSIAIQTASLMSTADDYADYIQQDYLFHTALAQGTGNRFLLDLVERINTHSTRCLMLSSTLEISHEHAIREHTAVVDALESLEYERARQAMADHLQKVCTRFISAPDETE
jgi:DNA-binding GntR family transcriptional regulator